MALSGLHSITNYEIALKNFIESNEGTKTTVHTDGKGIPTIGAGYALSLHSTDWFTDFIAAGITYTQAQKLSIDQLIADAKVYLDNAALTPEQKEQQVKILVSSYNQSPDQIDITGFVGALFLEIKDSYEQALKAKLGVQLYSSLQGTSEKIALVDLVYNGGANIIGDGLKDALTNDNRAEAWFEVRYFSNGGDSYQTVGTGIAKRRVAESNLFSLYSNSPDDDAYKQIMRMFIINQQKIYDVEHSNFMPSSNTDPIRAAYEADGLIDTKIAPAKSYLISNFSQGTEIDGDVLVGAGLDSYSYYETKKGISKDDNIQGTEINDLIFGEKGVDTINGGNGQDVIYGGDDGDTLNGGLGDDFLFGEDGEDTLNGGGDNDTLDGGEGNDTLNGGTGDDTYIAGAGDTISDTDGIGSVSFDGKSLSYGSRTKDDPPNKYQGGGNTYELDGTTLTVNGTLTILNYSKDDETLGIKLEDLEEANDDDPNDATDNAEKTVSPLALDLDGDGLETLSEQEGVYFDHDKNGLAEKTGWVTADDGLLVLDRNQDGIINDGSELFGNNTVLSNGTNAANAYEALAELDDNSDGVINNQDAAFADLRIWQDINSDGVSQQDELLTLGDVSIQSLNTGYQSTSVTDGNGNTIKQTSLATKTDDSTIETADIWFDVNTAQTVDRNTVTVSDVVAVLPEARAFGNVRSLQQSMMNDAVLTALVTQFSEATTNAERLALMDDIIYQWTGSAEVDPYSRDPSKVYGHVMDARQLVTLENLIGRSYLGTWCWGERDPNPHGRAAPKLIAEYERFKAYVTAQLMSQTVYQDAFSTMSISYDYETLQYAPNAVDFITHLEGLIGIDDEYIIGAIDTFRGLTRYSSGLSAQFDLIKADPQLGAFALDTIITGTEFADTLVGGNTDDYIRGNEGDDSLFGGAGNDQYFFDLGDGSDRVYDASGQDKLNFGLGISLNNIEVTRNLTTVFITVLDAQGLPTGDKVQIDNVYDFDGTVTGSAIETIHFADGTTLGFADFMEATLVQEATDGDDVLYGTQADENFNGLAGDDTVYGGSGDDTYQFAIGDGQDIIVENSGDDTIEFTNGLTSEQVKIERTGFEGEDLLLHLFDENGDATGDSIRINKAYQGYNASTSSRIEHVKFTTSDGTVHVLSIDDLEKLYNVTELDDVIYGFESDDVISALSGIDTVHGAGGNDTLYGDNDDDVLYGENGDDTLVGGEGNDTLNGGAGNDTYFFASGDGHDIIDNTDSSSIDVLEFDSSISPNKVRLLRVGNDLFISIDRNTESIQVKNYFNGDLISNTALKEIRFANGSVLSVDDVINLTLEATQQADYIEAFAGDDSIAAMGGDDIVYAKTGNDMVSGDQGNDLLFGENGNDLLLGQQGLDQLYGGQGKDLLYGGNQNDKLYGNSGEDVLYGENDSDILYGGSQDDMLYGGNGTDELYGELGDDTLDGGEGKDLLVGGAGDDVLAGGLGNDTYLYAAGEGNDLIQTAKKETNGHDVLSLSGVSTDQIWLTEEGNNLVVSFVGATGQVTIEDWQSKTDAVDEIQVGGFSAYEEDLERLVSAMASFDVQSGSGAIVPQDVKDQLQPVLASSWHA